MFGVLRVAAPPAAAFRLTVEESYLGDFVARRQPIKPWSSLWRSSSAFKMRCRVDSAARSAAKSKINPLLAKLVSHARHGRVRSYPI